MERELTVSTRCGHGQTIPYFWWEEEQLMREKYERLWSNELCSKCEDQLPVAPEPEGALAGFVHRYSGKRYNPDDPEVKLLSKGKRGGQ